MTAYYLSEGKSDSEYYGDGRFVEINKRIDYFLRKIFGNFHWEGPRKWIGGSPPSTWTYSVNPRNLHIFTIFLAISYFTFGWLLTNTEYVALASAYLFMLIMTLAAVYFEYVKTNLPGAVILFGESSKIKTYLKQAFFLSILLIILVFLIGGGGSQEIIQLKFTSFISYILFSLFLISITEELLFRSVFTPMMVQWTGIIPGILISGIGFGVFHWYIFHQTINLILFSTFFGLVLSFWVIYKKEVTTPIFTHIFFNCIALIFLL